MVASNNSSTSLDVTRLTRGTGSMTTLRYEISIWQLYRPLRADLWTFRAVAVSVASDGALTRVAEHSPLVSLGPSRACKGV